jgi:hypothetical protein
MRTNLILILALAFAAFGEEGRKEEALGKGMRIAVVQQDSNPGKPEENRNEALRFARQALEQGAEVVLFGTSYGCSSRKGNETSAGAIMALFLRGDYLRVGLRSEGNSASTAKAVAASDINMRGQESPSSPPCSRS